MAEIHSYMEALMLSEEEPILFEDGQVIFEAGEPGREMYIVRSGSVDLRIGGALLERVHPGWNPRRAGARRSGSAQRDGRGGRGLLPGRDP